jgi:hypothetical protein
MRVRRAAPEILPGRTVTSARYGEIGRAIEGEGCPSPAVSFVLAEMKGLRADHLPAFCCGRCGGHGVRW